jgi:hypothetical protein
MNSPASRKTLPRRSVIAVIGDSHVNPESAPYGLAEATGRQLVEAGYRVLTGGMGGIMEAACRGAKSAGNYLPGDTIALLPGHDPEQANPFADIVIPTGLDHVRNSVVAHADAIVAIGGGAGTLSEICFAWMYKRLVIGMQNVGGWSSRLAGERLDQRIRYSTIPEDCIYPAADPAEVVRLLEKHLSSYKAQHTRIR